MASGEIGILPQMEPDKASADEAIKLHQMNETNVFAESQTGYQNWSSKLSRDLYAGSVRANMVKRRRSFSLSLSPCLSVLNSSYAASCAQMRGQNFLLKLQQRSLSTKKDT